MNDEYYGYIENNDFRSYLSHEGKKGMRWGIRHDREALNAFRKNSEAYENAEDKLQQLQQNDVKIEKSVGRDSASHQHAKNVHKLTAQKQAEKAARDAERERRKRGVKTSIEIGKGRSERAQKLKNARKTSGISHSPAYAHWNSRAPRR